MANQASLAARNVSVPTTTARKLGDIRVDSIFKYAVVYTFPTGGENFNNVLQILSDAHFICMSSVYENDHEIGNMGATTATPYVHIANGGAIIQLTDGGTQRQLSNLQIPVSSFFGNGSLPHIWEFTHLFKANTQIGILITGMGAAAPFAGQTIRLTFIGMKVPVGSLPALGL